MFWQVFAATFFGVLAALVVFYHPSAAVTAVAIVAAVAVALYVLYKLVIATGNVLESKVARERIKLAFQTLLVWYALVLVLVAPVELTWKPPQRRPDWVDPSILVVSVLAAVAFAIWKRSAPSTILEAVSTAVGKYVLLVFWVLLVWAVSMTVLWLAAVAIWQSEAAVPGPVMLGIWCASFIVAGTFAIWLSSHMAQQKTPSAPHMKDRL